MAVLVYVFVATSNAWVVGPGVFLAGSFEVLVGVDVYTTYVCGQIGRANHIVNPCLGSRAAIATGKDIAVDGAAVEDAGRSALNRSDKATAVVVVVDSAAGEGRTDCVGLGG